MTNRLPDDDDSLSAAVELYRERFGFAPPIFEFMGRPRELARELAAAVVCGEPLTVGILYERLRIPPPSVIN